MNSSIRGWFSVSGPPADPGLSRCQAKPYVYAIDADLPRASRLRRRECRPTSSRRTRAGWVDLVGPLCFTWNKDGRFGRSCPCHWKRWPRLARKPPRLDLSSVTNLRDSPADGPRTAEDAPEDGLDPTATAPARPPTGRCPPNGRCPPRSPGLRATGQLPGSPGRGVAGSLPMPQPWSPAILQISHGVARVQRCRASGL